jgi:hypothetical protein
MATEAELILKLTDQTQAGFKAIQDSLKGLQEQSRRTADETKKIGDGISGMGQKLAGWAAGFLTVKAASDLLVGSLKAQGEQEAAINRLNLALANQGNFTEKTSQALQEYADHLQATTQFSDDAIISAEAMLASLGMNEEQIKRTTKAAADYAAFSGKDLATVTEQLGKAYAGNTAGLSKMGVVLDESVPKSQKFASALEQLEQRFAGSAEAATGTFQGGLAQVQNALGEVQEGLGKFIGTLFDSQQGFNVAVEAANRFANFLKVDMVLAVSEARAKFAEMFAGFLDMLANMEARLTKLRGNGLSAQDFEKMFGRAPKEFEMGGDRGVSALRQMADDQRKLADSIREQGNQAAVSAGKILKLTNSQATLSKGTVSGNKAVTVSYEEMQAVLRDVEATRREIGEEMRQAAEEEIAVRNDIAETEREIHQERLQAADEEAAVRRDVEETMAEIAKERQRALADLADALFDAGQEIGGVLGSLMQMGAVGIDVFQRLNNEALQNQSLLQKMPGLIQGATAAFQSGSAFGGAMAGASAGAAFGPIGAGIGAIAGGLLGIFGGASKARKELEKLKAQVTQNFGSMQDFAKAANRVGVDVSRAFSTKDPKEFERITKQVNQALEDQKKRMEGLRTAVGGLDLMTKGFAAQMERAGAASANTQASFSRLGTFAVATFAGLVRETGDVIGALQQMGPTLDTLSQLMADFGFQTGGAFGRLLQLRDIVVANEDVANSISGLNQLMKGLGDAGLVTKDILLQMGAQASANFDELIARGVPANDALALMQPTLQELWERQKQLGVTYDENTEKLLRQAEEQGLVGDQFLSTNEAILEVLKILAETLGATLPAALRRMGDAAEAEFGRMGSAATAAGDAAGGGAGFSRFEDAPGMATGGVVRANPPFGTLIRAGEDGDEFVLTRSQFRALQGGKGGGGGGDVFLDGHKVGKVMQRREEMGTISPKSKLRRAR